jgi:hypothetical protein
MTQFDTKAMLAKTEALTVAPAFARAWWWCIDQGPPEAPPRA